MSVLQLSLTSKQAKEVSQLLSSDTARRIMDSITEDSKSESEIAKELGVPLSTIHYNIDKLVRAGLVLTDEYTYSKKGKEVRHYRVASQHVLITTTPVANLASLLTGLGLSVAVATVFFINSLFQPVMEAAPQIMRVADNEVISNTSAILEAEAAPMAAKFAPETAVVAIEQSSNLAVWPWILLGAGIMLLGILIMNYIQRYR